MKHLLKSSLLKNNKMKTHFKAMLENTVTLVEFWSKKLIKYLTSSIVKSGNKISILSLLFLLK